jgi:hypothetical protein
MPSSTMTTEAEQDEDIAMEVRALATALRLASEVLETRVEPGKLPHLNLPRLLVPSQQLERLEEWRRKDVEATSIAINKLSERMTAVQRALTDQMDKAKGFFADQLSKLDKECQDVAGIKANTKEVQGRISACEMAIEGLKAISLNLERTSATELVKRVEMESLSTGHESAVKDLRDLSDLVEQLRRRIDDGFDIASKMAIELDNQLRALDVGVPGSQAANARPALAASLEVIKANLLDQVKTSLKEQRSSQPTNDDLTRLRRVLAVITIAYSLLLAGLLAYFVNQNRANAEQIQTLKTQFSAITKRLAQ